MAETHIKIQVGVVTAVVTDMMLIVMNAHL